MKSNKELKRCQHFIYCLFCHNCLFWNERKRITTSIASVKCHDVASTQMQLANSRIQLYKACTDEQDGHGCCWHVHRARRWRPLPTQGRSGQVGLHELRRLEQDGPRSYFQFCTQFFIGMAQRSAAGAGAEVQSLRFNCHRSGIPIQAYAVRGESAWYKREHASILFSRGWGHSCRHRRPRFSANQVTLESSTNALRTCWE